MKLHFDPFPDLTTERLVLRQLTQNDAPEIFMLRSDEAVNKFIGRKLAAAVNEAIQFIDTINKGIKKSESFYWAIALKSDPALIGTICYRNIETEKNRAEIGYELLPAFQGKGIMQEAIKKVIGFGFENIQLKMIAAFPRYDNKDSIKLLEKNNFKRRQEPEQEMAHDGNDYLFYALTPG